MPNNSVIEAFLARKTEIDEALSRLTALSNEHFNTSPETLNWGDVGILGMYADFLRRITDVAFCEGEYAK